MEHRHPTIWTASVIFNVPFPCFFGIANQQYKHIANNTALFSPSWSCFVPSFLVEYGLIFFIVITKCNFSSLKGPYDETYRKDYFQFYNVWGSSFCKILKNMFFALLKCLFLLGILFSKRNSFTAKFEAKKQKFQKSQEATIATQLNTRVSSSIWGPEFESGTIPHSQKEKYRLPKHYCFNFTLNYLS